MTATPLSILHLDMDAFYVAVEVQRDPTLAGRPVVVGGTGTRGVVASASYEARAFGVRSAMPTSRARRLCPDAVFLHGDHTRYGQVSAAVHRILRDVTPVVEPIALDEAFLDVSGSHRLLGDGPAIAAQLRRRVADDLGLTCSVGVATKKLLAKLASKAAKPRPRPGGVEPGPGVVVVEPDRELAFLHPHAVEALWGVGPRTLERLSRLGVETVGDLAALPEASLVAVLGAAHGAHLAALARGEDDRPVVAERAPKSIGHEETFARDLFDRRDVEVELVRLCDAVAARLRAHGLAGRTVTLKVRYGDFRTISRATTVPVPVDSGPAVLGAVRNLLADPAVDPGLGIRLLGVAVSGLGTGGARQLSFDEVDDAAWSLADRAVDEIRARYGADAIGPASVRGRAAPGRDLWGPAEGGAAAGAGDGPQRP